MAPGVFVAPPSVSIPISATFSVLSANNGREVARVTTDATGMYALSLHKGDYVLVPEPITMTGDCTVDCDPIAVTVDSREITLANIFYFYLGACSVQGDP